MVELIWRVVSRAWRVMAILDGPGVASTSTPGQGVPRIFVGAAKELELVALPLAF